MKKFPNLKKRGASRRAPGKSSNVRCSVVLLFLGLWTVDCGLWTCHAQSSNSPSRLDFSSFRIITERNIFNPRRSARYVPTERTRRPSARTDSFALVGTMSYEKGFFAFFDGSSSEYRKVAKEDDTIAGFKVTAIDPAYVKLVSATNSFELHVGMQLRHEADGSWRVSERQESAPPSNVSSSRLSSQASTNRLAPGLVAPSETSTTNTFAGEAPLPGPESAPPFSDVEPEQSPGAEPATGSSAIDSDPVLQRLARQRAAERGETP